MQRAGYNMRVINGFGLLQITNCAMITLTEEAHIKVKIHLEC